MQIRWEVSAQSCVTENKTDKQRRKQTHWRR